MPTHPKSARSIPRDPTPPMVAGLYRLIPRGKEVCFEFSFKRVGSNRYQVRSDAGEHEIEHEDRRTAYVQAAAWVHSVPSPIRGDDAQFVVQDAI